MAAIVIVSGLMLGVGGSALVQAPAPCGPFRVAWNRGELSPSAGKLEGFVYNDSACSMANVRIRVVALDDGGRQITETLAWVFADVPPGGRGYFAFPLP